VTGFGGVLVMANQIDTWQSFYKDLDSFGVLISILFLFQLDLPKKSPKWAKYSHRN